MITLFWNGHDEGAEKCDEVVGINRWNRFVNGFEIHADEVTFGCFFHSVCTRDGKPCRCTAIEMYRDLVKEEASQ